MTDRPAPRHRAARRPRHRAHTWPLPRARRTDRGRTLPALALGAGAALVLLGILLAVAPLAGAL